MPRWPSQERKIASCHPDRPIQGHGLCAKCYYQANKDRIKERAKAYRAERREEINATRRAQRAENPEKFRTQEKSAYYNRLEAKRASARASYAKHKDRRRAVWAAAYAADPERRRRALERTRDWREANPERRAQLDRASWHRWRSRLKDGVSAGVSAKEWRSILDVFGHACAYCLASGVPLTRDHVEPLSRGGRDVVDNVVPACAPCNFRKQAKTLARFLTTCPDVLARAA